MEDNWADKTSVAFVIPKRVNDDGTRVFHVKTQSSSYVLGFFDIGGQRPFAMMRGMSQGMGHEIDLRDSDPRVGDASLLATPPEQWIGARIDMAGTKTSPVASATEEKNPVRTQTMIRTLMQPVVNTVASAPASPRPAPQEERKREQRRETPYPENIVEYVEALASTLRKLASNSDAVDDIGRQANLLARLKVALMNARVAGEDVARRMPAGG